MTVPNSLVVMVPSPSLSNSENASLNSERGKEGGREGGKEGLVLGFCPKRSARPCLIPWW